MIPKTITILGTRYKVKIGDGFDDTGALGKINFKKKTIDIHKKQTPQEILHVYIHECFHGVFEHGRLNEVIKDDLEEIVIEQMTTFLLDHFTVRPK